MENVLDLYHEDYDPDHPVVCFDETSKQLVADKRPSIGARPGRVERYDYEYERNGTRNLFMFCEPKAGWRYVEVTERRTAVDFAHQVHPFLDHCCPPFSSFLLCPLRMTRWSLFLQTLSLLHHFLGLYCGVFSSDSSKFDLVMGGKYDVPGSGTIIRTEHAIGGLGFGGYGGLIDPNGVIWSARGLLRWDTALTLTGVNGDPAGTSIGPPATSTNWAGQFSPDSYGLCIDSQGNVWNTQLNGNLINKYAPDGTFLGGFPHGQAPDAPKAALSTATIMFGLLIRWTPIEERSAIS